VDQNSKVFATHIQLTAYFIFVFLFKKDQPQKILLFCRQTRQDRFDQGLPFLSDVLAFDVDAAIHRIELLGGIRLRSRFRPDGFEHYIVARRIHVSAQMRRMLKAPFIPQRVQNPEKRLLPNFFSQLRRADSRAQLDPNQFAEVGNKASLCTRIAFRQQTHEFFVKSYEFYASIRNAPSNLNRSVQPTTSKYSSHPIACDGEGRAAGLGRQANSAPQVILT
jgi:hypothetical protein